MCIHEYIVFGPSSSLSHSSPPQWCIACATALISNKIHAIVHPAAGSMSHDAVKVSPHTHCQAAIVYLHVLVYCQARTRDRLIIVRKRLSRTRRSNAIGAYWPNSKSEIKLGFTKLKILRPALDPPPQLAAAVPRSQTTSPVLLSYARARSLARSLACLC